MKLMRKLIEKGTEAGAFGLSTGLQYPPGNQSDTSELVELGKSVAKHGGVFTSHLRSYTASTLSQAMSEVAEVARRNDMRGQISHIFSLPWFGPVHEPVLKTLKWLINHQGVARIACDLSGRVRDEGHPAAPGRVQLGFGAGRHGLHAYLRRLNPPHGVLPPWALTGGREAVLKPDRGLVREGYFADLLVMGPERLKTKAVFRDPERYPEGLSMVLINGRVVLDEDGMKLDPLPGKMPRR